MTITTPKAKISFNNSRRDFHAALKSNVDAYFTQNGIDRGATLHMYVKTAFWIATTLGLYLAILVGQPDSPWVALALAVALGFSFGGVGFNIGHDAIHGSYSEKKWINSLLSWSFDLIGANSFTWSQHHNFVHHTYTNIPGHDGDIEAGPVVLLHPRKRRTIFHRLQHIYAWPLYGMTSLIWVFQKDFMQIVLPDPATGKRTPPIEFLRLAVGKAAHIGMLFVLPMMVLPYAWWQIVLGFIAMHWMGGFTLTIVFQLAHVVESTIFVDPTPRMADSWAEHQMKTTANFGGVGTWGAALTTFICGGLNYQVEHHLFPRISHVHYAALSPIVKKTALEHGLPYNEAKSFFSAVASHHRMLKQFGRPLPVAPVVLEEPAQDIAHAAE